MPNVIISPVLYFAVCAAALIVVLQPKVMAPIMIIADISDDNTVIILLIMSASKIQTSVILSGFHCNNPYINKDKLLNIRFTVFKKFCKI